MALLEAKNIIFTYPDQTTPALKDVSFEVEEGDFIVLCGSSGSGKSTLLRLMKQEIAPHGDLDGQFHYKNNLLVNLDQVTRAKEIGMVFQDPENQIVMERVMDELIFGLENLGLETVQMRQKVAEMVHFFGLEEWLDQSIHELSGGQKQMVNLASVLLMEPKILLLDEPTSQLDPIAAKDFLNMLRRMNEELGITVIIAEHRLEDVWPLAERVLILNKGSVLYDGSVREVTKILSADPSLEFFHYLPEASKLYLHFHPKEEKGFLPITVKEGQQWIKTIHATQKEIEDDKQTVKSSIILEAKNLDFQYEKTKPRILDRLSIQLKSQEKLAIVGGNGSGKSTLLKVLAGLMEPQRGKIHFQKRRVKGRQSEIAYLPQNPRLYFSEDSVALEIEKALDSVKMSDDEVKDILDWLTFTTLKDRHPYDLSGGEMQKLAMACLFFRQPDILLIDEPTKGLDPFSKRRFGGWLNLLNAKGVSILFVTHDIEFAARYADRVGMMFKGEMTTTETAAFFRGNAFYTTVVDRITRRGDVPEVLTVEEAARSWIVKNGFHS